MARQSPVEVCQWLEHLRCRSGEQIIRLRKTWHTDMPSVQGIWTPFTNLDPHLAVTSLPNEQLSLRAAPESATDYVLKLARENVEAVSDDTTQNQQISEESDQASSLANN